MSWGFLRKKRNRYKISESEREHTREDHGGGGTHDAEETGVDRAVGTLGRDVKVVVAGERAKSAVDGLGGHCVCVAACAHRDR